MERVIGLLGARPVRMSALDHDRAVALVSHLPQLLAATLMNEATDRGEVLELVAGSFRDLTRVAASDPVSWVELLRANRGPVLDVLDEYVGRLGRLVAALDGEDGEWLAGELTRAAESRRRLGPPLAAVGVALADQPGELARVGHALELAGVDVRDLQLRHAPFGGGGVLTVSVRAGGRGGDAGGGARRGAAGGRLIGRRSGSVAKCPRAHRSARHILRSHDRRTRCRARPQI